MMSVTGKRTDSSRNTDGPSSKRIKKCNFGDDCYRKNPIHLEEFCHPHLNELLSVQKAGEEMKLPDNFKTKLDPTIVLQQLQVLKGLINKGKCSGVAQASQSSGADGVIQLMTKFDKTEQNAPVQHSNNQSSRNLNDKGLVSTRQPREFVVRDVMHPALANKGRVAAKLDAAAPYHIFLTTVLDSQPTHSEPLSLTFAELLDPSLGTLKSSLQINFMVDPTWLMKQYQLHGVSNTPMLILYGVDEDDLRNSKILPGNVTALHVKPPHPFGHHHTKMSLFHYEDDSLRVVVSTANLIESDWENRTQGVWVSPRCPQLAPEANTKAGESPTEFKADLIHYLNFYKLPQLNQWVARIRRADFSDIRVCFVGSVPGTHKGLEWDCWGHRRLAAHLKKHATIPDNTWPIVAQCSSIGSLGPTPDSWMCGELRSSFAQGGRLQLQPPPQFKVVYPSFRNVAASLDGIAGGACLPYSMRTHQKQTWFTAYLNEWKSSKRHRSEAVPHIKTYTRVSPDGSYLGWFHLTSANLSKAAWGMHTKGREPGLFMLSYEAGVLFLPKFLTEGEAFPLAGGTLNFPLPYDLPLSLYGPRDKPWVSEYLSVQ